MGIYNGTHHVIRFRSGEIWYFSFLRSRGIVFQQLDKNGTWAKPHDLISNATEDFSVTIDHMDHLHMICRSDKGELLYLLYNGTSWSRQVLALYEPVRYAIRYPVVIPLKNKIHILFAIGNAFNTGYWALQHYYWDETSWHSTEISKFTAGYRLSPFYVDLSEKHIHLVYRGLAGSKYQIFYCRYHLEHDIWSTPENVIHSAFDCNMPSIFILDNLLHLTWTSLSKSNLAVKYMNRPVRNAGKLDWSQEIQLNGPGSNAAFPRLIWVEERLWCIWYQTDTLYGSSSEDQGASWSTPVKLPNRFGTDFHYIHYSTNHPRENQTFRVQWILGNVEGILYLPIAEKYMDLPEYTPNPPSTNWISQNEDLLSLSRGRSKSETEKKVSKADTGMESIKNVLLNEFDRQEELHYSLISKLDEHSRLNGTLLDESRQMMALLRENQEMLQVIKRDVEQIKQDIRQLKSRGWLGRLFYSG
jgi:hypothetical protein